MASVRDIDLMGRAFWSDKPVPTTNGLDSWGGWYYKPTGEYLNIIGQEVSGNTHYDIAEELGLIPYGAFYSTEGTPLGRLTDWVRLRVYRRTEEIIVYPYGNNDGSPVDEKTIADITWDIYSEGLVSRNGVVFTESKWGNGKEPVSAILGLERIASRLRHYALRKVAAWADVYQKALRIASGQDGMSATIRERKPDSIVGEVVGEHGTYDVAVYYNEGTMQVTSWWCTCFTADTLITMADGSVRRIADVEPNDMVLSGDGVPRRVVNRQERPYAGEVCSLRASGSRERIVATPNHGFYVWRDGAQVRVEAGDLRVGDMLLTPLVDLAGESLTIDMSEYCDDFDDLGDGRIQPKQRVLTPRTKPYLNNGTLTTNKPRDYWRGSGNPIAQFIDVDYEMGYLFGLYLGDGNLRPADNEVMWTFGAHEEHIAMSLANIIFDKFGLCATVRPPIPTTNTYLVRLYSPQVSRMLKSMCGQHSGGKAIASALFGGSKESLAGILDGWDDSDAMNTCSRSLASQMELIALSLGKMAHVYLSSEENQNTSRLVTGSTKPMYRLTVDRRASRVNSIRDFIGGYRAHKVTEIVREPYRGTVYNLEVEVDHTYLAHGYKVANCAWGQWTWIRRKGRKRVLPNGGYSGLGGRMCSHAAAMNYLAGLKPNRKFEGD